MLLRSGRLEDLMDRGAFGQVAYHFVLDEADHMLD